ncbi:putative phosphoserine phosphatase [Neospora caninum Liverpool]|uniref:phosphoserine phosphatase n=1 Tax=Neospora caninum (strain Liverpool) TaxID=572307 RepID=F0V8S6_NEOCL|nr:putative phosphoserine phosphatase [Neospora caninum Liverpool]CBZ50117.1 putative phosphoserine phosphatase [Neospora caninum Liverpool]|eukprot:XP_003880152.1 putative phosphoserine phosphatase [Neospora caninum Liverpool]
MPGGLLQAVSNTPRHEGGDSARRVSVPSQLDHSGEKREDETKLNRMQEAPQRYPRCHLILYAQGTDRPGVSLQFARWLAAEGYEDEEIEVEWEDWGVELVDVRQIKVGTMCCLYYHVKLNQHVAMEVLKACLFTAAQVHYELDYQLLPSHPRRAESAFAFSSFPRVPTSPSCSLCYSPSPSSDSVRGPLAAEEEREEIEAERFCHGKDGTRSVSPLLPPAYLSSAPTPTARNSACDVSTVRRSDVRRSNPPSVNISAAPRDMPAASPSPQAGASPQCASRRHRGPWEVRARPSSNQQLREAVHAAATLAVEAAAEAAAAAATAAEAVAAAELAGGEDVAEVAAKAAQAAQAAAEAEAKAAAAEAAAATHAADDSSDERGKELSQKGRAASEEGGAGGEEEARRDRLAFGHPWRQINSDSGSPNSQRSRTDSEKSGKTASRGDTAGTQSFAASPESLKLERNSRRAPFDAEQRERSDSDVCHRGSAPVTHFGAASSRQREVTPTESRKDDNGGKSGSDRQTGWPCLGHPRWSDVVVLQILQTRPVLAASLLSDVLAALLRAKATVQSMGLESVDLGSGGLGERMQSVEIKVKFPAIILPLQTKVPRDKPSIKALEDELKNICKRHDAQMLLRWDDFFSQALLQEHGGVASEERVYMRKLTKLKGASAAELIKKALPHLTIARGAFFLLFVLKKLGVRTALMTHSCQEVAHCVGRLLGIDYVLSNHFEVRDGRLTGRVVGGSSSSEVTTSHMLDPLRKMDWLQLLRDKERVERDALFVLANYEKFDFLHGAAGFCCSFNARRDRDISAFLLLLGMKRRHLQEFHSAFVASSVEASLDAAYPLGLTALVQQHQVALLAELRQPAESPEESEKGMGSTAGLAPQDVENLHTQEVREQQRLDSSGGEAYPRREAGEAAWPVASQRRPEDRRAEVPDGRTGIAGTSDLNGDAIEALEKAERRARVGAHDDATGGRGEGDEAAEDRPGSLASQGSPKNAAGASSSFGKTVAASACNEGTEKPAARNPFSAPLDRLFPRDSEDRTPLRVTSSACSVASSTGGTGGERRVDRAVVCVYGQVRSNDATPQLWRLIEALRPFEQGRSGGGSTGVCTPASARGPRGGTASCGIAALQLVNLHHHICLGMTLSWTSPSSTTRAPHRLTSSGSGRSDSYSSLPSMNVAAAAVAAMTTANSSGGAGVSSAASLFPRVSPHSLGLPASLSVAPSPLHLSPVKEVLFVASCLGLKASFIPQLPNAGGSCFPYTPGIPVSPSTSFSSVHSCSPEEKRGSKEDEEGRERDEAAAAQTPDGRGAGKAGNAPPGGTRLGDGGEGESAREGCPGRREDGRQAQASENQEGSERSFYLVVMEEPSVSPQLLVHIFALLYENFINIEEIDRLSMNVAKAIRLRVAIGPLVDVQQVKKQLLSVCSDFGADVALQADDISRYCLRLVVFDMDSTLVCEEVIDELAREAGVMEEVAAITQAAMEGHLDFHASLMKRVKMLKGVKRSALDAVAARLTPTPGAAALCRILRHLGYRLAVISGGFTYFARRIKKLLRLHHAFANHLQIDPCTGTVTGEVEGPVVTAQRKVSLMRMLAEVEQVQVDQVIAVGDGSNDIPLLLHAGMGVAFCAKKRVKENSNYQLNQRNLFLLVHLLGISEKAALQLAQVEDVRDD